MEEDENGLPGSANSREHIIYILIFSGLGTLLSVTLTLGIIRMAGMLW